MPTRIEIDDLQELIGAGAQLVEALPQEAYQDQHLPGAINIPIKQLDGASTAALDKTAPLIVYCSDYT